MCSGNGVYAMIEGGLPWRQRAITKCESEWIRDSRVKRWEDSSFQRENLGRACFCCILLYYTLGDRHGVQTISLSLCPISQKYIPDTAPSSIYPIHTYITIKIMKLQHSLSSKILHSSTQDQLINKPAIISSLKQFIHSQSKKIDDTIATKKAGQERDRKMELMHREYVEKLRGVIEEDHVKHEKRRGEFLEKRVSREKFRLEEVKRRRSEHGEKMKERRKSADMAVRKFRATDVQFWKNKQEKMKKAYERQISASTFFADAANRKKFKQQQNELYAREISEMVNAKIGAATERYQEIINEKVQKAHGYNRELQKNQIRSAHIMEDKEKKIVDSICSKYDKTEKLLTTKQKQWLKKIEAKHIDQKQLLERKKDNLSKLNLTKTQSLKDCRCSQRIADHSARSSILNEQQSQDKLNRTGSSLLSRHKYFQTRSSMFLTAVLTNREMLRQKQQVLHQRKMMREKQLSQALRLRKQIQNTSNSLMRQARLLAPAP